MPVAMSGQAPDAATIERLGRAALARIPEPFASHLDEVVLIVEEFADEETLDALQIEDPLELSGIYSGPSLGEQSSFDSGRLPNRIHLYRMPILYEWAADGEDLETLIWHIVIHEVGHHFGLSDADMHALEDSAG